MEAYKQWKLQNLHRGGPRRTIQLLEWSDRRQCDLA